MEMIILLTIFLIIISLGRSILQEGKICLVEGEQIDVTISIKFNLKKTLSRWAVKFAVKEFYMLSIVTLIDAQKATQIALIPLQNIKLKG